MWYKGLEINNPSSEMSHSAFHFVSRTGTTQMAFPPPLYSAWLLPDADELPQLGLLAHLELEASLSLGVSELSIPSKSKAGFSHPRPQG